MLIFWPFHQTVDCLYFIKQMNFAPKCFLWRPFTIPRPDNETQLRCGIQQWLTFVEPSNRAYADSFMRSPRQWFEEPITLAWLPFAPGWSENIFISQINAFPIQSNQFQIKIYISSIISVKFPIGQIAMKTFRSANIHNINGRSEMMEAIQRCWCLRWANWILQTSSIPQWIYASNEHIIVESNCQLPDRTRKFNRIGVSWTWIKASCPITRRAKWIQTNYVERI